MGEDERKETTVVMSDEDRLEGRAVHAEARAAASEHRQALMALRSLLDQIPQVVQAKKAVAEAEAALGEAQQADRDFRMALGEKLDIDLSDPSKLNVNWKTGEITLVEVAGADEQAAP